MTTSTLLLTGGRAPVCLELARAFAGAGWCVIVAESLPVHLCSRSRAVSACYRVPEPNGEPERFIDALAQIIQTEQVDLLIPTCEESFWVSRGLDRLLPLCRVLVEPLERLRELHSKWDFINLVARLGMPVPATTLLTGPGLPAKHEGLVLKPVFSRFASKVQFVPPGGKVSGVAPTEANPWVAQQWLKGRQFSTWSVAHAGRVTAHADYAAEFTAGGGACISFRPANEVATLAWVERFVGALGFTGQIAFDFIQTADGTLYPLECNPRSTSGLHLFKPDALVKALTDPGAPLQRPEPTAEVALRIPLLLYGPQGRWRRWLHLLRHAKDAIHRSGDPWPLIDQVRMLRPLWLRSRRQGISLIEATTADLEWNGER